MFKKTRIVIVGNGFGGVYTLRNLQKFFKNKRKAHFLMIGEKNYFLFTPLLHEVATGGISPANIIEPIRQVLGRCLDEFYLGSAERINTVSKTVEACGVAIPYDYLVLALGAETNFYGISGAEEHSMRLKSLSDAIKIKNRLIEKIETASHLKDSAFRKRQLSFVVVGGGPTGVELAAEIADLAKDSFSRFYSEKIVADFSVTLIQRERELLPQFGLAIREKSLAILRAKGIKVMLGAGVVAVSESAVTIDSGERIETENVIWVAGIKPKDIQFDAEVSKLKDGRFMVDKFLRLKEHPEIFALGDNAGFLNEKNGVFLPSLAQVAERQAKSVAENIYLSVASGDTNSAIAKDVSFENRLKPFHYRHLGGLVSAGKWNAFGEFFGFVFRGRLMWWLWRTVYLFKMISFRKKLKVGLDWTVNLFSIRDISEF